MYQPQGDLYHILGGAAMEWFVPVLAFCILLSGFGFSLYFIFCAVENYPELYARGTNQLLRASALFIYLIGASPLILFESCRIFDPNWKITHSSSFFYPCLMFSAIFTGLYWLKICAQVTQKEGDDRWDYRLYHSSYFLSRWPHLRWDLCFTHFTCLLPWLLSSVAPTWRCINDKPTLDNSRQIPCRFFLFTIWVCRQTLAYPQMWTTLPGWH